MLVTVYQKGALGWRAIRSFYRFDARLIQESAPEATTYRNPKKPRFECPGCLNLFTDAALEDHVCFGGAPGYPQLVSLNQRGRAGRPKNNLVPRDEQTRQPD
jgi:hypothetical protein